MLRSYTYLKILCDFRGWSLEQYQRRQWMYIRITRDQKIRSLFAVKGLLNTIRTFHPAARVVRHDETEIVFNIGTIFDIIRDEVEDSPLKAWTHNILRVKPLKKH